MYPARNGPFAGQGFRRIPVAAQARPRRGETPQEAAARRLNPPAQLRVGFAGTPAFAAAALEAIHRRGYTIPLVLTQPDRPFGRGLANKASDVKAYAVAHGLPVAQPASIKDEASHALLRNAALDVLVVAAYGLILPQAVLDLPRHGCLNVHASLLPRWRGAAPVARAIEAGDEASGITIMRMDAGLDTGPIVAQETIALDPRETAGSLHDKLAVLGAAMIVEALGQLAANGALPAVPQPATGATYAAKIESRDTAIDWARPALRIDRQIRALAPSPGATTTWRDKALKLRAACMPGSPAGAAPGCVTAVTRDGIDVACGEGTLRITDVQPAAGRTMHAHAFALGHRVGVGDRFGHA